MMEHIVEDSTHVTIAEDLNIWCILKCVAMLISFQKALSRNPLRNTYQVILLNMSKKFLGLKIIFKILFMIS